MAKIFFSERSSAIATRGLQPLQRCCRRRQLSDSDSSVAACAGSAAPYTPDRVHSRSASIPRNALAVHHRPSDVDDVVSATALAALDVDRVPAARAEAETPMAAGRAMAVRHAQQLILGKRRRVILNHTVHRFSPHTLARWSCVLSFRLE